MPALFFYVAPCCVRGCLLAFFERLAAVWFIALINATACSVRFVALLCVAVLLYRNAMILLVVA